MRKRLVAVSIVVGAGLVGVHPAVADGPTRLVSQTSAEQGVDDLSLFSSLDRDGDRVAFQSFSDGLVPGDGNGLSDVFVRNFDTGTTRLVSVGVGGADANGASSAPAISANGRYVVFTSDASNLVGGDGNGVSDVFRRDLTTGTTVRVSVGLAGVLATRSVSSASVSGDGSRVVFQVQEGTPTSIWVRDLAAGTTVRVSAAMDGSAGTGSSYDPRIAAGGRFAVFLSQSVNLVPNDTNGFVDVFRRDLVSGVTTRVSLRSDNTQSEGDSDAGPPAISASGRYVVYNSHAFDVVPNDTNGEPDIFWRDIATGTTQRISVTSQEQQVSGFGGFHTIRMGVSDDGRYASFSSDASGLTSNDTNGQPDVFVRDTVAGTTTLVSVALDGESPFGFSTEPSVSGDGHFVSFSGEGTGITADDTNGEIGDVFRRRIS